MCPYLPDSVPGTVGVRVPLLRRLARDLAHEPAREAFLASLPHKTYDEDMLHALLLSQERDYREALRGVEEFLPCVDNWAVCDTLSPKAFGRHRDELLPEIRRWAASGHAYTCRFGLGMLMKHYLDDVFDPVYLKIPAAVRSEEYYVRMMVAWFFATALAKQWEAALPYIEGRRLDEWTHRKAIQKACESFRVPPEHKAHLKTLR